MEGREGILDGLRADPRVSVLILGGGINGVGLLRELALQGIDALLVEKADFTAGATSKSSRMIHGGLRYLENREFGLVRQALRERNRLLANAPHYVSPLRTTIPLFSRFGGLVRSPLVFLGLPVRPGGRGALLVKSGLLFYDFVTRKDRRTPKHFFQSREETLREIPALAPSIVASATYWDASIAQAERLAIELIQDAAAAEPRCRALNYIRVEGLEDGAVRLSDPLTGAALRVVPRVVVNATGAWVDRANAALGIETRFIGGTKGSHLVLDHPVLRDALGDRMVYYEHADGRICIAFAFLGKVIMGSTDIPVEDPDRARCEPHEVQYMRTTLRGVFPSIEVPADRIVRTFCGVRPLPAVGKKIVGTIPRGHAIRTIEPDGARPFPVICLIGGKWTTFRALAEEAADRILPILGARRRTTTASIPIGGGRDWPWGEGAKERWIERVARETRLRAERVATLLARFGTKAEAYARSLGGRGETPLETLSDYTREEIAHIARTEFVEHLGDLVCRRSVIALLGDARRDVLLEIAGILAEAMGWDPARREEEVARAEEEIRP